VTFIPNYQITSEPKKILSNFRIQQITNRLIPIIALTTTLQFINQLVSNHYLSNLFNIEPQEIFFVISYSESFNNNNFCIELPLLEYAVIFTISLILFNVLKTDNRSACVSTIGKGEQL